MCKVILWRHNTPGLSQIWHYLNILWGAGKLHPWVDRGSNVAGLAKRLDGCWEEKEGEEEESGRDHVDPDDKEEG